MSDGFDVDQTSTTTTYEGSGVCSKCGNAMTPVEVAYNGTLCSLCRTLARQNLVRNKRVGPVS